MHNLHLSSGNNPHNALESKHQVRFSVNVWTGFIDNHLIGNYFLPSKLIGRIYSAFLNEALPELLENVPVSNRRGMWFQQDGAPSHFVIAVRQLLDSRYPNRWIGCGGSISST